MHETGRKAKIERLTIEGKTVDSNNLTKFNLTKKLTITNPNFCLRLLFFLLKVVILFYFNLLKLFQLIQAQKSNLIA